MTLEIGRGWPRVGERAAKAAGDLLANHTLVVGQSRSGKSTAVRRIIEEVLLKTSARVVVLDPNSDFSALDEFVDENGKAFEAWSGIRSTFKTLSERNG